MLPYRVLSKDERKTETCRLSSSLNRLRSWRELEKHGEAGVLRIKSLLLFFFRKEDPSFLKERSKELLLSWVTLPAPPVLMLQAFNPSDLGLRTMQGTSISYWPA